MIGLGLLAAPATAAPVTIVATATQSSVRLESASGRPVLVLRHGRYRLTVHDRTRRCGFRLATSVSVVFHTGKSFVGTVSRPVTLTPGSYTYSCGSKSRTGTLRVR
jgi:hypothetical protein